MALHISRFITLILSVSSFILVSCEDNHSSQTLSGEGKGKVMLSLYSDIEVKSPQEVADVEDYNFRFVGVGSYGTSQYYRYSEVEWPMEWYYGIFRLQAESCTLDEAEVGYGKLRYEGIGQPFSVINDQTVSTSVICSVANFRVGVSFNDKMFMSYKDFKLVVESVLAPVYEDDVLVSEEQLVRSLEFNTLNKVGYYNPGVSPMNLRYTLYVMVDGAEEFVEMTSGYFSEDGNEPSVVLPGDLITLSVNYVGEVRPSEGIKFIVQGERKSVQNGFEIEDYIKDSVTEDE